MGKTKAKHNKVFRKINCKHLQRQGGIITFCELTKDFCELEKECKNYETKKRI